MDMTDNMVHMVYNILVGKPIDISAILMIITEIGTTSAIKRLPYGLMITCIMEVCKVSFPPCARTPKQVSNINLVTVHKMRE